MAKQKRVPLNRLVLPATLDRVKALAEEMECSEGDVLDKATAALNTRLGSSAAGNGSSGESDLVVQKIYERAGRMEIMLEELLEQGSSVVNS